MEQQTLGKYEIRRELGRGGAGVVYEGWDPDLARTVALKTVRLPPVEDEETTQQLIRFRQEAQAAARLSHPNIVQVYDYGRIGELSFIAMEFVEGGSLKQLVGQAVAPAEAVRLVRQVLAGLTASHALGVVHRDIKPDNIMLRGDQAKIADFGIARITSSRPDPGWHRARHAILHVARTVPRRDGRSAHRYLVGRGAAVPVADRKASLRGRRLRGDHAQGADHRAGAALHPVPARPGAAGAGPGGAEGARQATDAGWPLRQRRRVLASA